MCQWCSCYLMYSRVTLIFLAIIFIMVEIVLCIVLSRYIKPSGELITLIVLGIIAACASVIGAFQKKFLFVIIPSVIGALLEFLVCIWYYVLIATLSVHAVLRILNTGKRRSYTKKEKEDEATEGTTSESPEEISKEEERKKEIADMMEFFMGTYNNMFQAWKCCGIEGDFEIKDMREVGMTIPEGCYADGKVGDESALYKKGCRSSKVIGEFIVLTVAYGVGAFLCTLVLIFAIMFLISYFFCNPKENDGNEEEEK